MVTRWVLLVTGQLVIYFILDYIVLTHYPVIQIYRVKSQMSVNVPSMTRGLWEFSLGRWSFGKGPRSADRQSCSRQECLEVSLQQLELDKRVRQSYRTSSSPQRSSYLLSSDIFPLPLFDDEPEVVGNIEGRTPYWGGVV